MWEGHRIIYPHLREKVLENKKEPFLRPALDEQELETLNYILKRALDNKYRIQITFWTPYGPEKKDILPLKDEGRGMIKCLDSNGQITLIALNEVLEIREL